jgi:hypothetical protein
MQSARKDVSDIGRLVQTVSKAGVPLINRRGHDAIGCVGDSCLTTSTEISTAGTIPWFSSQ